ncbi:hypothetical protein GH5_06871 [Leishmania sp. Ghana 2012 LV757]|uniref:hypothetical protein n=1 Tax=Leishmania sp. Ghana 2012 LV757 TaxID=2803181 RepID=UPI001B6B85F5|nr:hypothetical protein GH5_06871 [Leishmania sp. Ghana 2012 LV757]
MHEHIYRGSHRSSTRHHIDPTRRCEPAVVDRDARPGLFASAQHPSDTTRSAPDTFDHRPQL